MKKNLSVILIAHNEEATIGIMIDGLLMNYPQEILELIVVDDASIDKTAYIAESRMGRNPEVRLVKRTPPCGVGRALKAGFNSINPKADFVLTMDSDFTKNIEDVKLLIRAIEEKGLDGVIGSRFTKGGGLINYPLLKRLMNRLFHFFVKALFHIKQSDLTNNFKLYNASIIRSLPWMSNGYAINAEIGLLPVLSGYRIGEVPILWFERDAKMGESKFRIFRDGFRYILVLIYSWRFKRLQKIKS